MKKLILLLLTLSILFFIACKESDDKGISLLRPDGKDDKYDKEGGTVADNIVLYRESDSASHDGGFASSYGDRAGMDSFCGANSSSVTKPYDYPNHALFISAWGKGVIEMKDPPYNIPTDKPIVSKGGTLIANNWADLFNGTITNSLETAGVLPGSSSWWSGSEFDGTQAPNHCSNFTVFAAGMGEMGMAGNTDMSWIRNSGSSCNSGPTYYILCVAY